MIIFAFFTKKFCKNAVHHFLFVPNPPTIATSQFLILRLYWKNRFHPRWRKSLLSSITSHHQRIIKSYKFLFIHRQIFIFSFQLGLGRKFNFLIIHGIKKSLCFKIQSSNHFSSQHSMLILFGLKRSSARFNNEKIMSSSHKFLYP